MGFVKVRPSCSLGKYEVKKDEEELALYFKRKRSNIPLKSSVIISSFFCNTVSRMNEEA